ncbi:hypothetical protein ACJX0J_020613, partial [Zea mays]
NRKVEVQVAVIRSSIIIIASRQWYEDFKTFIIANRKCSQSMSNLAHCGGYNWLGLALLVGTMWHSKGLAHEKHIITITSKYKNYDEKNYLVNQDKLKMHN